MVHRESSHTCWKERTCGRRSSLQGVCAKALIAEWKNCCHIRHRRLADLAACEEISSSDSYFRYSYQRLNHKVPIRDILYFESKRRIVRVLPAARNIGVIVGVRWVMIIFDGKIWKKCFLL